MTTEKNIGIGIPKGKKPLVIFALVAGKSS